MREERQYEGGNDPQIFSEVRAFLKELHAAMGRPLEELSPQDARQILTDTQESVMVDYSGY